MISSLAVKDVIFSLAISAEIQYLETQEVILFLLRTDSKKEGYQSLTPNAAETDHNQRFCSK